MESVERQKKDGRIILLLPKALKKAAEKEAKRRGVSLGALIRQLLEKEL